MTKTKIFVYGTLRPGKTEPVLIPGEMFDLGWFPGVKLSKEEEDGPHFLAEEVFVDDETLYDLDRYEGYDVHNTSSSLYVRKPYQDGFIYEYNGDMSGRLPVPSGDWLDYTQKGEGSNAHYLTRRAVLRD